MLKYALFENNLTSDPDDYMALVQPISTKTMEDLADMMISRGSTVTKAEVLSVMEEFTLATMQCLKDGHNIATPLFKLSLSVKGVFDNAFDSFDASRHEVSVRVNAGTRLKEVVSDVKTEKVSSVRPLPVLQSFRDVTSGSENETLTPGGVGHIIGTLLRFDATDAQQGVFFTATNGTVTKAETVVTQRPSEIIFTIPAGLVPGEYSLSVRSILHNRKDLREGFLIDNLTVA